MPVWPHPAYAVACAQGAWQGHVPAAIPLDEWLEDWLPGVERDGRLVAARMRADLGRELEQYE